MITRKQLGIVVVVSLVVGTAWSAAPAADVNLLIVGDWGVGGATTPAGNQRKTARAMAGYARSSGLVFDATLVTGDSFKTKISGINDPKFRQGFEEMYDFGSLPMPFYAVLGAHDYEYEAVKAQLEYGRAHPESRWKMPARWYRLDLPGANPLVTILMLDSNRGFLGKTEWAAQAKWLGEELAKPRNTAWTLCVAHNPLFSDGGHGDDKSMQAAWGPLLKKHHVDFYVSGHDHILQHLRMPGWPTTFLISGGGGENTQRPISGNRSAFVRATLGFAAMQFSASSVRVRLVDDTGETVHQFEREPRSGKEPALSTSEAGVGRQE